jgi:hypothetical protein
MKLCLENKSLLSCGHYIFVPGCACAFFLTDCWSHIKGRLCTANAVLLFICAGSFEVVSRSNLTTLAALCMCHNFYGFLTRDPPSVQALLFSTCHLYENVLCTPQIHFKVAALPLKSYTQILNPTKVRR